MRLKDRIKSRAVMILGGFMLLTFLVSACGSHAPAATGSEASTSEVAVDDSQVQVPSSWTDSRSSSWIPDVVEAIMPSIVQISVRRAEGQGSGTGIVFDADGTIITNWHIVESANEIDVILPSGVVLDATLMREDSELDLAVLTVDSRELVPAQFGDSDTLRVGEDVVSIGHAFGLIGGPTVSRGIVSALNRTVSDSDGNIFEGLIQTDAAINLGSSGGALINSEGQVVGINVGSLNVGQGANFALDVNTVMNGTTQLVAQGEREQPGYLGVGGIDVTPYMAFQQSLPFDGGLGVRYIDPESPAAAELQVDDIIVSIDDTRIRGLTDFTEFLRTHPDGTDIVVTAVRGIGDSAVIMEIPVTLSSPGA